MRDMGTSDARVGLLNRAVAAAVAASCVVAMLVWGLPGLDPSMWEELAVVAGLRPAHTVLPGFWRFLAEWIIPHIGPDHVVRVLNLLGAAVGGLCVYTLCLIIRQILSLVIRVNRPYRAWHGFIAPFFAGVSALAFGVSEPFLRAARTFSPEEIHLFLFLAAVHASIRWFVAGGRWRLYSAIALMGVMAAEMPFAFILPAAFIAAYVGVWHCVVDGLFPRPERFEGPDELPKWRMFFLFVGSLALAVFANATSFTSFGGLEAAGLQLPDVYLRYSIGYWRVVHGAASLVGWMLGIGFAVLPFVMAVRLAPFVIRDDRRMPFELGVLMVFLGFLAAMQTGAVPSVRFWTFVKGTTLVESGFLLMFFVFCDAVAFAVVGAAFAFECQRNYLQAPDAEGEPSGLWLKASVPALAAVLVALALLHLPKPREAEMQRIVDEAVAETVEECGDAKWIFTDGHLDAAIEYESFRRGGRLTALNMMSGAEKWETSLRRRNFEPGSADDKAAETGVPVLLRTWIDRKDGLRDVALQLGLDIWRRDRRPMPKCSGMIAREFGLDDDAARRGVERAEALSRRILAVGDADGVADVSPALKRAFSAVNWRLSRFARLREDIDLADRLDDSNALLKRMVHAVEKERMKAFMQMTPMEGLQMAMRRADFVEARRFAVSVLEGDEEHPEANFAMGMSAIRSRRYAEAERYLRVCLKVRPDEPATVNNLSIVCRKQGKWKEAEEFARQAIKLLPDSSEVKQTLNDALKRAP